MARPELSPAETSDSHREDLPRIFQGPIDIRSISITGIFLLGLLYSLYFAREFLLPVVLAFILSFLLAPAVRWMNRQRIPQVIGAVIIVAGLVGLSAYGVYRLATPAQQWLQKAPSSFNTVRRKLQALLEPMQKAQQTTAQIEKMTTLNKEQDVTTVEIKKPGLGEFFFTGTQNFLIGAGVTVVLLYFLLASGDLFLLKLVKVLPTLEDKKRAVEICREVERNISKYLWTITLVNAGLGLALALAMSVLGMPNPSLWGVMAAFFSYVPYLGPTTGILSLGMASALTFDDPVRIFLPPAAYFLLAIVEGNFLTPLVLGRRLALNPVVIFVWLIFWAWVWGVPGAVLAVPLLAILKIVCDHLKPLSALGEFLGKESKPASL
ncbi:MAG TPA: AI-2E family transporter [Candidatus Acidoferrales bacterium]|nr:AI-2E family transporter [Candidatus Acidoferrales bacterium]